MTDADLERLLKLIILGQAAFAEAMKIINNHKSQAGKTDAEILDHAEKTNQEALEIINNL